MAKRSYRCARAGRAPVLLWLSLAAAVAVAACATQGREGYADGETAHDDGVDASVAADATPSAPLGAGDASPRALTITPSAPVVDVQIVDGVTTGNAPLALRAVDDQGADVVVRWSLDRGDLGNVDAASGVFRASAALAGSATVTATAGGATASVPVVVRLHVTQNGRGAAGGAGGGVGGAGGVGGEGLGGAVVNASIVQRLRSEANVLGDLAMLYPYDGTVWPRGLRAPLLQWSTATKATAVAVQLRENGFEFDGVYSVDGLPELARQRQPIDEAAWKLAADSNQGDALEVSVKIYAPDADRVYGPLTQRWSVSPAALQGTIYYNTYDSRLVQSSGTGAVLALRVGNTEPTLAVASTRTTCVGCHTLSENGAYLFAQDASYSNGAAYSLPSGARAGSYTNGDEGRKFLWAGVFPDGSFGLSNSRHGREHASMDSQLWDRATGGAIPTTGFSDAVKSAVTPAFAGDGKRVAFNFWEGPGAGGVTSGNGHSLVVMDFDCHKAPGATSCGQPPYAFSGLREIYRDANRYPGWPGFAPDMQSVVFHNTRKTGGGDGELATWQGAEADLWIASLATGSGAPAAFPMRALNGVSPSGASYLPRSARHPNDEALNYEPTVGPIASGGYFWVVFTSRRAYGNVATGDPYEVGDGTHPVAKKLWVAAVDLTPKPGVDPSHPAFYLPGQELNAGNMRGYWAVDPCAATGASCTTGAQCCTGFCRASTNGGPLTCADAPAGCAHELERCATDADCCDAPSSFTCLNGRCARNAPR